MRYLAEPAFVLHARPWRETSLLVEVLTAEHGRVGLVARGVQGPKRHLLRAALQPLQSIRFDAVQKGELAQLHGAEAIDAAPLLHGDAAMARKVRVHANFAEYVPLGLLMLALLELSGTGAGPLWRMRPGVTSAM